MKKHNPFREIILRGLGRIAALFIIGIAIMNIFVFPSNRIGQFTLWGSTHSSPQMTDFFPVHLWGGYDESVDAFLHVRVSRANHFVSRNFDQTMTLGVIDTIWSRGVIEIPETIQISRMWNDHIPHNGSTYLLPLVYNEASDSWSIRNAGFVLFGVDNRGLVRSHSLVRDFNRFNGSDLQVLIDTIHEMTQDENFEVATSTSFARSMGNRVIGSSIPIKATVLDYEFEPRYREWGPPNHVYRVTLHVDRIILQPATYDTSWIYPGQEIVVFAPYNDDVINVGESYFLSLWYSAIYGNSQSEHTIRFNLRLDDNGFVDQPHSITSISWGVENL
ncbi:MAG: hypothetical protein FWB98_00215 [Defluviitaleaceae bacterium]|nr:hypothetical protein [Defluviitaleaceae bacterium]